MFASNTTDNLVHSIMSSTMLNHVTSVEFCAEIKILSENLTT
jgi:hypothetical protein